MRRDGDACELRRQRCAACELTIRGDKRLCPLCHLPLPAHDALSPERVPGYQPRDAWPFVPAHAQRRLAIRILALASIVIVVLSFALQYFFPIAIRWPLLVVLALASSWLSVSNILVKRRSIAKAISWQLGILSLLALVWDYATGWHGWALAFAIPFLCIASMLTLYTIALVMRLDARDWLVYLLIVAALGLVPLIFLILDLQVHKLPSLLSVALSVILIAAVLIFNGRQLKAELERRLHL